MSRFREAMENKLLPWKNLTAEQKTPDDVKEMKISLMEVLQNFAQFSIDPNEVIDVSIQSFENGL